MSNMLLLPYFPRLAYSMYWIQLPMAILLLPSNSFVNTWICMSYKPFLFVWSFQCVFTVFVVIYCDAFLQLLFHSFRVFSDYYLCSLGYQSCYFLILGSNQYVSSSFWVINIFLVLFCGIFPPRFWIFKS